MDFEASYFWIPRVYLDGVWFAWWCGPFCARECHFPIEFACWMCPQNMLRSMQLTPSTIVVNHWQWQIKRLRVVKDCVPFPSPIDNHSQGGSQVSWLMFSYPIPKIISRHGWKQQAILKLKPPTSSSYKASSVSSQCKTINRYKPWPILDNQPWWLTITNPCKWSISHCSAGHH